MNRRLLAISWDMPPLSGPRAVQVSRTLKQLVSHGWDSWVVCFGPRSNRYNQDRELASRLRAPAGVTLVPVPSHEERLVFRTLWRVAPPLKLLPDEKWVWIRAAARAAERLAAERRFDALVSFAQPWSDHLVGLRVQRATGLPWIAHFSDPWTDSPYLQGRRWQRRVWARMEADVVRGADALVFVNVQTADHVMRKYPSEWRRKVHVIPHGFDPDEPPPRESARHDARLTIVHTGRFYEGVRTPESLLRALATLERRRPLAGRLRVVFVGTPISSQRRLASALGLNGVVEFTGRLSSAESAQWAAAADVLLVIDAPADVSLFLPSKLIDYLPTAKPILALTPPRGASADVIRALGYPVIAPDDEVGIAGAVETLLDARNENRLTRSPSHHEVAQQYDISGGPHTPLRRCSRGAPETWRADGDWGVLSQLSGGGLQARAVVKTLADRVAFSVLTTSANPSLPARADEDGVPIRRVYVDPKSAASQLRAALALATAFAGLMRRFDIVNLHGFSRKAILLVLLTRLFGKRFILTLQTGVHDEPAGVRASGALSYWAFRQADLYLSVSPALSQAYRDAGLEPSRLRQISNAVDSQRFRPAAANERAALRQELGLPASAAVVVFVGFFSREKRPDLLYDAWARTARAHQSALLFIGATRSAYHEVEPGLADGIRNRATADGLADRVLFVESSHTIEKYFRAADVYVLPSIREGFPIALLEAMSSGLPCVATRLPGSTDAIIEHGVNGLLAEPDDGATFGEWIEAILGDAALAARLGAAARQTIADKYSIERVAAAWLAAYRDLAPSQPSGAGPSR